MNSLSELWVENDRLEITRDFFHQNTGLQITSMTGALCKRL